MRIPYSQLKKLPVETRSGTVLGRVSDVVLDVEVQHIVQYEVKQSRLSTKKYVINREQVVSITAEKIIVEDAVVRQSKERLEIRKGKVGPEAVAVREKG